MILLDCDTERASVSVKASRNPYFVPAWTCIAFAASGTFCTGPLQRKLCQ